jgi:hypothetical protein
MSLGYIVNNEWFELLIPYTPNSEDDGDAWDYSVGFSSECQIAAGSLVVSWGNPNEENEEHCKNMGVNDQHNWLYLSKAALNTSTGEYTYIPVKNISDIKIVSQDSSNPLTISETDADAGYYLFAFEKGNESGTYLIKVGNSYVGIEKSPEIVSAYVADGKTNLTEKEYYYALDTASAADDDDRTFYVSFSKANLGEENSFYDFYVGNRSDEEGNGTAGEYYYFADSSLNDSETDWAGNTIKKLTSDDVAVEVQSNDENGVVLKITVSENAPANLSFHVGTIVKNNEEDLDPKNPWIEEKYILVTNVSTAVDKDSKSLDTKAVDNGNVTITDVPSIADLDLETNLGDAATLSGDEAASAKKVEISIRTDVIEQKDDKFKEILSDSYSATFLDLSVKATVTKAATNDNGNVTAGASVTVPITRTNQPFTIKVPIPTNLQAKKGFSIIRYHEGKTEKLEATIVYENGKPSYLEFKTDRFSTYALAYREATAVDNLNFNDATWEVTGDNTFSYDGTGKTLNIEISGMPEGCTYTLKGTTATAEGSYTVYVDKITYGGKEYAASDVELPSVIAKGYTWSILDANLTAVSDNDDTEEETPTPDPTPTPDKTPDKTDDATDKKDDTSDKKDDTSDKKDDTSDKKNDTSNSTVTATTTVKKGTTTKNSGNTYTVTDATKKTVAFTSVKKNAKTVKIPSKVTINGASYKVTSVAANAFKNNKKLTKVVIPSSVTKIGASAFSGCTKLATVTISKNVTSIGKSAFSGCTSLKKITLPAKLTTIGASAFSGCKKLTSVTIPANVKSIGKQAFYNCSKLSKVTIKSTKIKTIGSKAFTKTAKKTTITVPSKKKTAYKKLLKKAGYTNTVK